MVNAIINPDYANAVFEFGYFGDSGQVEIPYPPRFSQPIPDYIWRKGGEELNHWIRSNQIPPFIT